MKQITMVLVAVAAAVYLISTAFQIKESRDAAEAAEQEKFKQIVMDRVRRVAEGQ